MSQVQDVHALIEEVVVESRLPARTRNEVRKELESHVWETASELREQGLPEEEIASATQARFGAPKEIGRSFSFIYGGFLMRVLKSGLIILGAFLLIFLAWPPHGSYASGKYYTFLHEKFGDQGWYSGAVMIAAAKEQGVEPQDAKCKYQVDGEKVENIPFGNILTLCYERWLVLKKFPPIQLGGPKISPPDVVDAMRKFRALQNAHSVFYPDPLSSVAARTLESYLESLALGAGRTKTKEVISNAEPFPDLDSRVRLISHFGLGLSQEKSEKLISKSLNEMRGFPLAALYLAGDVEQLRKWNPDVASDDLPKLLAAACAHQMQCLMPVEIETVSIEKKSDSAVVTLRAFLDSSDEAIANHPFLFEVTRLDIGTKNDWTDDEYNVTKGFASFP